MDEADHVLHVATAGWNVPRELATHTASQGTVLQKYARLLGATEINSTFYRRHRPGTFARWRDSVPDGFRFAVKMPRSITHEAALVSPRAELSAFFSDLEPLGNKLGPILVQLPASVHFEARRVRAFFRLLRSMHPGPVACEPRHASWYGSTAERIFVEYQVARVLADPPRPDAAAQPGGWRSLLYVRWHGSPRIYWSAYSPERLRALALFVRKQPPTTNVWCVFDNTAAGAALHDARRFIELCRGAQPDVAAKGQPSPAISGSKSAGLTGLVR
ncbi:MAG: DUF72 domain-containing protein [Pseudomonadota bacterium]